MTHSKIQQRRLSARGAMAAALVLASTTSMAQGAVTLYGGARAGGDFYDHNDNDAKITLASGAAIAASYDWILADGRQAQIFYSFQRSALPGSLVNRTSDISVGISYLHAGGRVYFDGAYNTSGGYLGGGLGVTYFKPDLDEFTSEVRASMSLALGYQWMLSPQVALRTEMRGYLTLINSSGGFFCSGGCTASIRGDTLAQFEALAGLSYMF